MNRYFGLSTKDSYELLFNRSKLNHHPWMCYLTPTYLTTPEKKVAVKRIKFPETYDETMEGNRIWRDFSHVVEECLSRNMGYKGIPTSLCDFDAIIPVPSTSTRPADIHPIICSEFPGSRLILLNGLVQKNVYNGITVNYGLLKHERMGYKVQPSVVSAVASLRSRKGERPYESKDFIASHRRYLNGLLRLNPNLKYNPIEGKHVIISEDSVGEFVTLKNMVQLVESLNPATIMILAMAMDYSSGDKYKDKGFEGRGKRHIIYAGHKTKA
jgi:hypothetical protein